MSRLEYTLVNGEKLLMEAEEHVQAHIETLRPTVEKGGWLKFDGDTLVNLHHVAAIRVLR